MNLKDEKVLLLWTRYQTQINVKGCGHIPPPLPGILHKWEVCIHYLVLLLN